MSKGEIPVIGWFSEQVSAMRERRRYPQPIERVKGEEQERLMLECRELLRSTDFDGTKFNQWISAMIQLLGGQRESTVSESSFFRDSQTGYCINICRSTEAPWDFGWIDTARLVDPEVRPESGNVLIETLTWGERTSEQDLETKLSIPIINYSRNSEGELVTLSFDSFFLGKPVEEELAGLESIVIKHLTPQIAQNACQRVFAAYERYNRMFPRARSTTRMGFERSEEYRRGSHGIR